MPESTECKEKKKSTKKQILNMPVKVSVGKLIPRMWPDKLWMMFLNNKEVTFQIVIAMVDPCETNYPPPSPPTEISILC